MGCSIQTVPHWAVFRLGAVSENPSRWNAKACFLRTGVRVEVYTRSCETQVHREIVRQGPKSCDRWSNCLSWQHWITVHRMTWKIVFMQWLLQCQLRLLARPSGKKVSTLLLFLGTDVWEKSHVSHNQGQWKPQPRPQKTLSGLSQAMPKVWIIPFSPGHPGFWTVNEIHTTSGDEVMSLKPLGHSMGKVQTLKTEYWGK